jgi:hypothetical protein
MDTSSQSLPVRLELTFSALNALRTVGGQGGYWGSSHMGDSTNQIVRADIYGMVDVRNNCNTELLYPKRTVYTLLYHTGYLLRHR